MRWKNWQRLKKTIAGVFINDANVESCREETLYILNSDTIIEKYYKAIGNRIKFCLGLKPKTDADKERLLAQVKYTITDNYDVFMALIDQNEQMIIEENVMKTLQQLKEEQMKDPLFAKEYEAIQPEMVVIRAKISGVIYHSYRKKSFFVYGDKKYRSIIKGN